MDIIHTVHPSQIMHLPCISDIMLCTVLIIYIFYFSDMKALTKTILYYFILPLGTISTLNQKSTSPMSHENPMTDVRNSCTSVTYFRHSLTNSHLGIVNICHVVTYYMSPNLKFIHYSVCDICVQWVK